ncbi:MAG: dihydrofolate reductase [Bacteroidales bacterium]|nr:dihydrofolate reductase [Bacteroidales bacterium]
MTVVSIIVAVAENNVIGKDNKLIWHLPADLAHFKSITMGHHIIMGRKTFESIGKPLPGRTSVIITKQKDYKADGCIAVSSLEEALKVAVNDAEVFIVGGAEIYRQSIDVAGKIYFTKVYESFEGDVFFPEIDMNKWKISSKTNFFPDEKNKFKYSFIIFVKK